MAPSGILRLALLLALAAALLSLAFGRDMNGFDLSDSLVPGDQIHLGGPARDGIPAIDEPRFDSAAKADHLEPGDRVLGLVHNGQARAYPIAIMNWHEVVNDEFAGEPVAITYCPLCGSGVAFAASLDGEPLSLGVSGLLYNSDVLLYDRETESLWSQLLMQAISGPRKGERLRPLPLIHTTWRAWRQEHPGALVLSTDTGHRRDYRSNPYEGYVSDTALYFPVRSESRRYHPKERVLGLEIDGQFKAYPFAELSQVAGGQIRDVLAGRPVQVRFDRDSETARAFDDEGGPLPAVTGFWFAWYAFHPETAVFTAKDAQDAGQFDVPRSVPAR
jgi:hypothetical protein